MNRTYFAAVTTPHRKDTIREASGRVGNCRGRSDIMRGVVKYILLGLEPEIYRIKI